MWLIHHKQYGFHLVLGRFHNFHGLCEGSKCIVDFSDRPTTLFPEIKSKIGFCFPEFLIVDRYHFWTQSWTENKFSIIFDTDTVFIAHEWNSAVWENTTWDCNMLSFWSTESLGHWDATVIRICQLKIDSWWLAHNGNDISCRLSLKIRDARTGPKWIPAMILIDMKNAQNAGPLQSTDFPDKINGSGPRPRSVPQTGSLTNRSSGYLRFIFA